MIFHHFPSGATFKDRTKHTNTARFYSIKIGVLLHVIIKKEFLLGTTIVKNSRTIFTNQNKQNTTLNTTLINTHTNTLRHARKHPASTNIKINYVNKDRYCVNARFDNAPQLVSTEQGTDKSI